MMEKLLSGRRSKLYLCVVTIVLFSLALSCGTTSMMISVKRPAEINLKGYDKIAMGDIVNPNGRVDRHASDVSDEITSKLFSSGHFEVLDRQHLRTVMEEHQLSASGLVDENSASELGKIIGAAVLVFGRIQDDEYKEETAKGEPWTDKKGNRHQTFTRTGNYNLAVNLKVIDIQTSKILAVKTLSAAYQSRTSADNKAAPAIDPDPLYRSCLTDLSGQFMKIVAPYNVQVKAVFEKDKKLPEVEQAITQLKIGEWDEGMSILKQSVEKPGLEPKIQAKAVYNLGLLQMYGGYHDDAIENFKKAMSLNPGSKRYQNAVLQAKSEKQKAEKLSEQLSES